MARKSELLEALRVAVGSWILSDLLQIVLSFSWIPDALIRVSRVQELFHEISTVSVAKDHCACFQLDVAVPRLVNSGRAALLGDAVYVQLRHSRDSALRRARSPRSICRRVCTSAFPHCRVGAGHSRSAVATTRGPAKSH